MASQQTTLVEKLFKSNWVAYVGIAVASISLVGALFQLLSLSPKAESNALRASQLAELNDLQAKTEYRLAAIAQEQARIRSELTNLTKLPDQSKAALQLKHIEDSLTDVQSRGSKLEDALLNNPAKALELPLLRKDLDGANAKNQAELIAIRQDVDRVYDQNKWFLGLMGTMALGTLTLAISNFFKKANP